MLLIPVAELLALRWLIFLPVASPCSIAESTLESGADVSAIVLWWIGDQKIDVCFSTSARLRENWSVLMFAMSC